MAYDNSQIIDHTVYGNFDFGGGAAEVLSFRGPPGKKGKLLNIGVSVVEAFANDATVASVAVGTAADADAYGLLNIADGVADLDYYDKSDDTDAVIAANIPADQLVQVTLTNGTDGTAVTGQGIPHVVIEWYD